MNETTQAAGNASSAASTSSMLDTASLLTTVHLIWLAIFAAIVVAGIIYGSRVKHRRVAAERRAAEHAAEAGVEATPADVPDTQEPSAAAPPPAAPPPAAPPPAAPPPPAPSPAATPASASDDDGPAGGSVTQLKGLGPKVAARLGELGVTTVGQIAALDDDAARRLDDQLGPFRGRLERDRWVEQARFLAAGDRAGFEAVFGKL